MDVYPDEHPNPRLQLAEYETDQHMEECEVCQAGYVCDDAETLMTIEAREFELWEQWDRKAARAYIAATRPQG